MEIRKYLLLSVLFCSSCRYQEPQYVKIADQITASYIKEFATPRKLILSGYGGAMMDDIKSISLAFRSFEAVGVDQARVLYIEMVEELLCRVNADECIRPYLHKFPFEEDNLDITLGFGNSKTSIIADGHVAFVCVGKNRTICYKAYDASQQGFYTLHKEPYEEARKIVLGK